MKITKTSIEVKMEQDQYKEAHDGCEKCPCCGFYKYPMTNGSYTFNKGFIKKTTMKVDKYRCLACGSEWESDPYDARLDKNKVSSLSDDDGGEIGAMVFYAIFLILLPILGLIVMIFS